MIRVNTVIEETMRRFNSLDQRQKMLVAVLTGVILFSVFYNGIYKPQNAKLTVLNFELSSLKKKLANVRAQSPDLSKEKATVKELHAKLESLHKQLGDLEAELPAQASVPELLGDLVGEAEGYSVDFLSIKPKKDKGYDKYGMLNIDMRLGSGYSDFVNYLSRLESFSKFLDATSIVIEESKENRGRFSDISLSLAILLGEGSMGSGAVREKKVKNTGTVDVSRNPFVSKFRTDISEGDKAKYKIYGIAAGGDNPTAIINNDVYRIGDKLDGMRVKAITPDEVVLEDGGTEVVVKLDRK
ncbi:MAG TPA: type 4a pilus biogenesis protein PilO [Candidatus Omnitrophota bacterium]|nr:type 4a pilus biogenesis protein PilO [Candidatus Omnitrophota bacterium]HPS20619.1 type 4a pilus biogenesis protein PilO [Candidatus Omnitrophota bacterium]